MMATRLDLDLDQVMPSPERIQASLESLTEHGVTLVNLQFSDIAGGTRTVTVPVSLMPVIFERGYRFDGAAMAGGQRQVELDLFLTPDPSTLTVFPGLADGPRRAQFFCWVTRRDGQPFAGDPRSTLQRQLQKAASLGFDYQVGIEMEFYLYAGENLAAASRLPSANSTGYFGDGEDTTADARDEIVATLQELGVGVNGAHHETGPGQQELDLRHSGGIRIADQIITTRQIIRRIAHKHGMGATFMAKPFPEAPGSGMHLFQRLLHYPDGHDLLSDPAASGGLTPTARHMIGGQLVNAQGMSAILCTTVNSYKRLADGHRAPKHATWARVSQASLVRLPASTEGVAADIELRSPDPMANPYLAIAAALGAALDGIRNKEEPIAPLDENLVTYDDDELYRLGIPRLPQTMGEALDALGGSDVIRETLGDYIFDQLLSVKRAEWSEYRRHVSPWEHMRYGDL
jgi:glutamine synthetase